MLGKTRFQEINALLSRALSQKKVLIAVHRGVWGGNIIENTTPSYLLSREMGADIFECDVSRSTDGVLYAFHDGGEKRMLGTGRNIEQMTSREIDACQYYNSINQESGVHVERLESVVSFFRCGELYNIDRAWNKLPETAAMLKKYPWAIRQAIIKSPVRQDVLSFLNTCPEKYMFMPIVYNMDEVRLVLAQPGINLVGMEVIAVTLKDEMFRDENLLLIRKNNLFVWANAITLSGNPQSALFGGLDDDMALLNSKDRAWGRMIEKGVNMIQTDWPFQLKTYLGQFFKRGRYIAK